MSNQRKFLSVLLLLVVSLTLYGCVSSCGFETGARVTPAFVAASGARVYVHPPKDKTLASVLESNIDMELVKLGFTISEDPNSCDLLAYYSYSYDWNQPEYIRDFMIVFKPYPGDNPALMASASCYQRCSGSFTKGDGREVHEAFDALREEFNSASKGE